MRIYDKEHSKRNGTETLSLSMYDSRERPAT